MMKREILFRGKSPKGRWIYGMPSYDLKYIFNDSNYDSHDQFEIISETVGQFTGLTDKNGAKIFEGDIVEAWSEGYKHIGEIRWRLEGQPAIIIYPAFANQGFWKIHGDKGMDNGVEVIGNIYDNPELINKQKLCK